VVKRQSTVARSALRAAAQAAVAAATAASVGRRRFRHWVASTLSSISTMFSQLPWVGV